MRIRNIVHRFAERSRPADALIPDRNSPQKHVWRAEIVLLSADGAGTVEIMRRIGKSKTCAWRWQEGFTEEGIEGLLHDKTRPLLTTADGLQRINARQARNQRRLS